MPTAEDEDKDRNDHDRTPIDLREMQLHHCGPGRAGNPTSGEPIAVLRLVWNQRLERPIMLNLTEARRLLAKLVAILDHFDDALGKKLAVLFFPTGEWPADAPGDVTNPRPAPKHLARPSVRITTPKQPLNDTDVWQLTCMLRHVGDHETFMQLIGVPDTDIRTKRRRENIVISSASRRKKTQEDRATSPRRKPKRRR
jgi:hypothetical protein